MPNRRVIAKIDCLKNRNPNFFSNAYFGADKLKYLLEIADVYETEQWVAIICNDNGVKRLYFFAESVESAAGIKIPNREGLIILEIIEQVKNSVVEKLFCLNGWKIYSRLTQWHKIVSENYCPQITDVCVEVAGMEDIDDVYGMYNDLLDKNVEYIPDKAQLTTCIKKGGILIIRERGVLAASTMIQSMGGRIKNWRLLVVGEAFRGRGLAQALIDFDCMRSEKRTVYTFWVIDDNLPAVKFHEKNGGKKSSRCITVFSRN